jgi:glutamate racemase
MSRAVGIFDSGLGGLAALKHLRKTNPNIDVIFFADYKNAPYGTKSVRTLINLVNRDIDILKEAGACKILIACCTASTVHSMLSPDRQSISIPIILPSVKEAIRQSTAKKIAVIGTERTVLSHSFGEEISRLGATPYEYAAQELVSIIESGARDECIKDSDRQKIYRIIKPIAENGTDTLILGCTHFDWIYRTVSELFPSLTVVSSPREGVNFLMREFENEKGFANTLYLSTERGYKNGKIQTWKNKRCGS